MSNQSSDSLQVECEPGFDGGLPQQFLLELVEMPALRLARNLSLQVSFIVISAYKIFHFHLQYFLSSDFDIYMHV